MVGPTSSESSDQMPCNTTSIRSCSSQASAQLATSELHRIGAPRLPLTKIHAHPPRVIQPLSSLQLNPCISTPCNTFFAATSAIGRTKRSFPENSGVSGRLLHNRAGTEARSCQLGDACCRSSGGAQETRVPEANRQLSSCLSGHGIGHEAGRG